MIQSVRNIRLRIRSVQNTQKITRAMEMVSSSKLHRVKTAFYPARAYFAKVEFILNNLLAGMEHISHPLLEKRSGDGAGGRGAALFVAASDMGLCGNYNHDVLRAAEDFISQRGRDNVKIIALGKEGHQYFKKRGFFISDSYLELRGIPSYALSCRITGALISMFLAGDADEVYAAYTRFSGTLRHKPAVEKFLNVEYEKKRGAPSYILEPGAGRVLDEMIPRYLSEKMYIMLLNSFTSEHSARMVAMKTATDNAKEMIDVLILMRNKARQAAITKEVIEIASAAEAVRGQYGAR